MSTREHWSEAHRGHRQTRPAGSDHASIGRSLGSTAASCTLAPTSSMSGWRFDARGRPPCHRVRAPLPAGISTRALAQSQARLGDTARSVQWLVGDITTPSFDEDGVDRWRDREVPRFVPGSEHRGAYVEGPRRPLRPGAFVIIATFGPSGPECCGGPPVTRCVSSRIAAALDAGFELVGQADEEHTTPWSGSRAVAHALCRRGAE